MRTPAAAIAWEFWRRHRWGWIGVASYLLALTVIRCLVAGETRPLDFDTHESFALVVIVPSGSIFMYLLAVFSFGLAGDLAGRGSMFPPRALTLPMPSASLAGWPMALGASVVALLWIAVRLLALWPPGFDVPALWPGVFLVVILAWMQALTWRPYALPGLRVVVATTLLTLIVVVVVVALEKRAAETTMLALLTPHLPVAYLVAWRAVSDARCGEGPHWGRQLARFRLEDRARRTFASPLRALAWFEWRRFGRSLPLLVAMLLPFESLMLFVFADSPPVVRATLLAVLLTPPFMATFVAAHASRASPDGRDAYELTPFLAARPVTSASLVAARLLVAGSSALVAWLLVTSWMAVALPLSATSWLVARDMGWLTEALGTTRAMAVVAVGASVLVLATWKNLVQSLYIGLSGRAWLVKGSVFAKLVLLTALVALAPWVLARRGVIVDLLDSLPWILAALVGCKLAAAAWIAVRLQASGLVSDRALILGVACWDVCVVAAFGVLQWLAPSLLFRVPALALVAILSVPLARVAAAPLALAWSRHR